MLGLLVMGTGLAVDTLGFSFSKPTAMGFSGEYLYVAEEDGRLWRVAGDSAVLLLEGLSPPFNGFFVAGDSVFLSHRGKVSLFCRGELSDLVVGLPSFGACSNNGLTPGPDGRIYLGQGEETCSGSQHALAGAVLRFARDGSGLEVFAGGFQDPFALAFQGDTLWVTDPGCYPGEEQGARDRVYRISPGGKRTVVELEAGACPRGLCFWGDTLFVACFGDPFLPPQATNPGLFKVFRKRGEYVAERLNLKLGRPQDLAVGPRGHLYVLDREGGRIFRIRRTE